MKVALETGEVLDVALVEGDRIVGTLSLRLQGLAGSKTARATRSTETSADAGSTTTSGKKRKQRKPMSAEARARMAEAQKLRWEKRRQAEGNTSNEG